VLKEDKNKNLITEVVTSLLSILSIYYFYVISHFIFVEKRYKRMYKQNFSFARFANIGYSITA